MDRRAPKRDEAVAFLRKFLASSQQSALDVYQAAQQIGIKDRTLDAAASLLKVEKTQRKGSTGWFWKLPQAVDMPVPDGLSPALASFVVAFDKAKSLGLLSNPAIFELAKEAKRAISEANESSIERIKDINAVANAAAAKTWLEKLISECAAELTVSDTKVSPRAKLLIQLEVLREASPQSGNGYFHLRPIAVLQNKYLKEYELTAQSSFRPENALSQDNALK